MIRRKWDFTIERGNGLERTVVGRDGQVHHPPAVREGRDGHFSSWEEWCYVQSITTAVRDNSQQSSQVTPNSVGRTQVIEIGPFQLDSFGILPSDGYGRLSSEDY